MVRHTEDVFNYPPRDGEEVVRRPSSREQGPPACSLVQTTAVELRRNYHNGGSLQGRDRRSKSGKPVFAQSRQEAVCAGTRFSSTFDRPEGHYALEGAVV